MSAKQNVKRILRHPYAFAVCSAFVVSLIYWQIRTDWRELRQLTQGHILFASTRSGTIAWKQPIVPAQFAQASCGACHRDDLAETPRLNHGRQLLVKYNCIGCHQLQNVDRPAMLGPDLSNVGAKVSREWIYKWLKDPRTLTDADGNVTVDGVATDPRMPKFQLSDLELRALSAYLSTQHTKRLEPARISTTIAKTGDAADQGQTRFNQMFCVTCHALAVDRGGETKLIGGDIGPELTKVGSKVKPEWLAAWLRDPQGYLEHTRMPRYQWSDKDLYQVTQFILTKLTDPDLMKGVPQLGQSGDSEVQLGRRLFVAKGCAECHVIQGVIPQSNFAPDLSALGMAAGPYTVEVKSPRKLSVGFHFVRTDVEKLDIHESIVPRSMIAYLQAKITNPASVTPDTHMPAFRMGKSDLDDLTTALLSMSGPPIPNSTRNPVIVERRQAEFHPDGEAGQLYQRYRCFVCHTFKGYGGTLAPDLSYEGSRSRREWLVQFLQNPQTLRPTLTVRMPHFNMPEQDAVTLADYLSTTLRKPDVNPAAVDEGNFSPQMAEHGKQLYEVKYQCQSCHTIGSAGGYVGPSLNNVGNWMTPAWIEAWLRNPQALVAGAIEPRHSFSNDEVNDITAYLLTLKQTPAAETATSPAGGGQQ
jgi:mono/diheme cytochrome c family protein